MTTQTIQSINEFSQRTQRSVFDVVDISHLAKLPVSGESRILFVTPATQAKTKRPPKIGYRLSDVVNELESTKDGVTELQDARRWVAETLYQSEHISLQSLRLRLGMSQSDLAGKLATTQARISIYERGLEMPTFAMMRKMTEAFMVDMNTLTIAFDNANHQR